MFKFVRNEKRGEAPFQNVEGSGDTIRVKRQKRRGLEELVERRETAREGRALCLAFFLQRLQWGGASLFPVVQRNEIVTLEAL